MTTWAKAPLGDVAHVVSGTTPPTSDETNYGGEVVWVTPVDLGKLSRETIVSSGRMITNDARLRSGMEILPPGTVVMSSRAPIGYLGVAGVPLCTNQGCKSFVPGSRIDSMFLYYNLRFQMPTIRALGAGATFAEVSKSALENFVISFPPIDDQRRIARELQATIATSEIARGTQRERLAKTQILRGAAIESGFKSASSAPLRSLASTGTLQDGDWILNADYSPSGVRLFQVGDIGRGILLSKSTRYISLDRAIQLRCTMLRPGDILISRMPDPIGRACVVPDLGYEAITAVDVSIFRPDSALLNTEYAVQFMNSRSWLVAAAAKASGATRARVSRLNLELLKVPLPAIEVQERLASQLRDRLAAIDAIEASIRAEQEAIDALPAALLRLAFGEVAA